MKGKRLILVSHCVLNQNAVVNGWERSAGAYKEIIKAFLEKDIGIIQLPCPEFSVFGENRPPLSKEEYDSLSYRTCCKALAIEPAMQIKEYVERGYNVIGILGIADSPSCDTSGNRGIFMEELLRCLDSLPYKFKMIDVPETYYESVPGKEIENIRKWISEFIE